MPTHHHHIMRTRLRAFDLCLRGINEKLPEKPHSENVKVSIPVLLLIHTTKSLSSEEEEEANNRALHETRHWQATQQAARNRVSSILQPFLCVISAACRTKIAE